MSAVPGPCPDFAEQRSALLDGALSGAERDSLLSHLVGCSACRRDVAELRAVRDRLRTADRASAGAGGELAARLVSIAGSEASRPLYTRPFTTADRRLPTSRRGVRRSQTVAATMLVTSLALAALLVGYVAAPAAESALDPAARARAEFASALGLVPLGSSATSAVVLNDRAARLRSPGTAVLAGPAPSVGAAGTTMLSREAVIVLLERALRAVGGLDLTGELYVGVGDGDERIEAQVGVVARAGQGTELSIRTLAGQPVDEVFQPFNAADPATALGLLMRLELDGTSGYEVAGRSASRISVRAADGVARTWWIDDATALVLWQQAVDASGSVRSSAGFLSVDLELDGPAFLGHLAPRLTVPVATAHPRAGTLSALRWQPPAALAGLPLLAVFVDDAVASHVVHAVYGDGVDVVSVVLQFGRLQQGLSGYAQLELDASTTHATPLWVRGTAGARLVAWQSGTTVFTVTTTGSPELLRDAVLQLPRVAAPADSRLARIRAGWTRILHLVLG